MLRLLSAPRRASLAAVLRLAATATGAGLVFAGLGPFGTYLNGGPVRLAGYWIAAMLAGLALYGAAYAVVVATTPPGGRSRWLRLVGAALIASAPEAIVTRVLAFHLWPALSRLDLPFALWFAQTATIGVAAMLVTAALTGRAARGPDRAFSPVAAEPANPPQPFGPDVWALQMEDHYVRVHRPHGSELVLMPLGRAIATMGAEGLRTHRSRHAGAAVEGDARSMRLRLPNGIVAPVARSAVVRLRAAGWLAHPDEAH